MQLRQSRFAFVKYRAAKDREAFDIEDYFREPLGGFEKLIRLETAERGEGVVRIHFRHRHDIVRLRIDLEFALEKILENEFVAQFCHVRDPDDVLRKLRPALHGDAVTSLGNIRAGDRGAVDVRVLVFQKVSADASPALFVLAETN